MISINDSILGKRKNPSTNLSSIKRRKLDEHEEHVMRYDKKDYESDSIYERDNHIYFRSNVNERSVNKLIMIINNYNDIFKELSKNVSIKSIEPNPIYLHITSYGGCVFSCFRAIDVIKNSKVPIYTIIDGHAASAGVLMSVVGKKKFITPSSYALIHQLSSGAIGTYREISDEFKSVDNIMKDIYKIFLKNTKMTKKEIKDYLGHDIWWNAKTCVDKTLVDEIYYGD